MSASLARRTVLHASTLLAAGGWLGLLVLSWIYGEHAGVLASFVFAATVAITFTVVSAVTVVMPDSQRIYAIGFRDGQGVSESPPAPRRLASVR